MSGTKGRRAYVKSFRVGNRVEVIRGTRSGQVGTVIAAGVYTGERDRASRALRWAIVRFEGGDDRRFGWGSLTQATNVPYRER